MSRHFFGLSKKLLTFFMTKAVLTNIKRRWGSPEPSVKIRVNDFLTHFVGGSFLFYREPGLDLSVIGEELERVLDKAKDALLDMRKNKGEIICHDLLSRMDLIMN